MLYVAAAMASMVLIADPPAIPSTVGATMADLACVKAAAVKLDDRISPPATIAKLVELQCSDTLEAMVETWAELENFDVSEAAKLRLYLKLEPIHAAMALRIVLKLRQERMLGHTN